MDTWDTSTAPVREAIEDGKNGLLVDFFDHDELAAKIAAVIADPENFKRLRENARKTIVSRYDLNSICLPKMLDKLAGGN